MNFHVPVAVSLIKTSNPDGLPAIAQKTLDTFWGCCAQYDELIGILVSLETREDE